MKENVNMMVIKVKAIAVGTNKDKLKNNIKVQFEMNEFSQTIVIDSNNFKNDLSQKQDYQLKFEIQESEDQ